MHAITGGAWLAQHCFQVMFLALHDWMRLGLKLGINPTDETRSDAAPSTYGWAAFNCASCSCTLPHASASRFVA